MTSVVTLAARALRIQKDSLSRIAEAQSLGRSHHQRQAILMFLDLSRARVMSLLIRTFTNWSRSIQGIILDRTAFDPVLTAAAFLTTLNSQVGSAYLQPSSLEDIYLDWEIVARTPVRPMRRATRTEIPAGPRDASESPLMTYRTPAASSPLSVEPEMPEVLVEPISAKMEELVESVGPKVGSLHRVAYFNEAFSKRAALLVASVSKPLDRLTSRFDRLQRRLHEVQILLVISGVIPATGGLRPREARRALLRPILPKHEELEEEALRQPMIALQTRLLQGTPTRGSAASAVGGFVQRLGLPLRLLRTAYSRYFLPRKSLALGLSAVAPSLSEVMPEVDFRGGKSSAQALSVGAVPTHAEAFTYVFTFVPTLHAASTSPQPIPIEIPLVPRTYAAAASHVHTTAETARNLWSSLPSLLSTALMLSGSPLYAPEGEISDGTTAAGMQTAPPVGVGPMIDETMLAVGEIRERINRLRQAAVVVQRRFAGVVSDVSSSALRVQMSLIRRLQGVAPQAGGVHLYTVDLMRDSGPSRVPQLPGEEGLTYLNSLLYSLPIPDMMAMAATSKNVWPRMISTARRYLELSVGSDVVLRARSSLVQDQVDVNEPYTAVMRDLILYASASAPSTMVVPPQVPEGLPSARLHEAVSFVLSTQQAAQQEPLTATRREQVVHKPLPVAIEVDSLRDESELRELQRKIARIIKDEARRHGVYS